MPGVGCKQSCANGKFFAPELTIMDVLDAKFEEVNERITCCKFRFHGYVPGYCTKFNANGLSLDTYCANQIWNGVAPVSAVTLLQVWPAAHTQHATRNMQYAARNTQHSTRNAQRSHTPPFRNCSRESRFSRSVHASQFSRPFRCSSTSVYSL